MDMLHNLIDEMEEADDYEDDQIPAKTKQQPITELQAQVKQAFNRTKELEYKLARAQSRLADIKKQLAVAESEEAFASNSGDAEVRGRPLKD